MYSRSYYISSALVASGLLLLQTTFIQYISIEGYVPDILLLWLVYIAIRRGQIEATISGFVVGLLQDLLTTRFMGLAALVKTISGFFAGYFFNENTTEQALGSYRYPMIVTFTSLIHDLIYFFVFYQGSEGSIVFSTIKTSLAFTFYTAAISILPMFAFSRKYNTSWAQ